ncbi:MAG TPA: TadE family type IV pilus minor pilin [Ornithinimicrobium sp.]|uniref:TadE family type IV pilus minor pilin n=1 Tax=Ornithinimicrobium sp. TaxID=1977084 RepID=UPI002B46CD73|nr:TadE family type IV pilus minor pilin [Ornithinimicrobium sp.]HKJ12373.1 TadE family type IV pilus minor pilin [Ornithinimicrobium sp.]
MVTAELAVAIPGVLVVLALCLGALALAVDQIRCVDAARAAARAASRGQDEAQVQQLVRSLVPAGSTVSVTGLAPDAVQVRVTAPPRLPWLPGVPQAASIAQAPLEPVTGG